MAPYYHGCGIRRLTYLKLDKEELPITKFDRQISLVTLAIIPSNKFGLLCGIGAVHFPTEL